MSSYRGLDGMLRSVGRQTESACAGCGMGCYPAEYHPHAACTIFKATRSSSETRAALEQVYAFGFRSGEIAAAQVLRLRAKSRVRQGQQR